MSLSQAWHRQLHKAWHVHAHTYPWTSSCVHNAWLVVQSTAAYATFFLSAICSAASWYLGLAALQWPHPNKMPNNGLKTSQSRHASTMIYYPSIHSINLPSSKPTHPINPKSICLSFCLSVNLPIQSIHHLLYFREYTVFSIQQQLRVTTHGTHFNLAMLYFHWQKVCLPMCTSTTQLECMS